MIREMSALAGIELVGGAVDGPDPGLSSKTVTSSKRWW